MKRKKRKIQIIGTKERPRLVVYRSLKYVYGQLVDDSENKVILALSSLSKNAPKELKAAKNKVEASHLIGKALGEQALKKNIKEIVFDRNGYLYHGRVKAFADGARKSGLKF